MSNDKPKCPECEYHKQRAALWRAEAYKQAGHDVIERPSIGCSECGVTSTDDSMYALYCVACIEKYFKAEPK
jgi:hypothetical protein